MVKYPLTPEAQQAAIQLVDDWNNNQINQLFQIDDATAGGDDTIRIRVRLGASDQSTFVLPPFNILLELSKFRLIYVSSVQADDDGVGNRTRFSVHGSWLVLLTEELRSAVATDFEVSDYFLTLNAVGTIVHGNVGNLQSAVALHGSVSQQMSVSELADELLKILGTVTLQNDHLLTAIRELSQAVESERQSKIGKVISELGRTLEHGANAFTIIQALGLLQSILR